MVCVYAGKEDQRRGSCESEAPRMLTHDARVLIVADDMMGFVKDEEVDLSQSEVGMGEGIEENLSGADDDVDAISDRVLPPLPVCGVSVSMGVSMSRAKLRECCATHFAFCPSSISPQRISTAAVLFASMNLAC